MHPVSNTHHAAPGMNAHTSNSGSQGSASSAAFNAALNAAAPSQGSAGADTVATRSPTQAFGQNPLSFLSENPGRPLALGNAPAGQPQLPSARPGSVVPGASNQINYHVDTQGNQSTIRPGLDPANPNGNSSSAYWLPYSNGGTTNTISVPSHPTGNDPRLVLTPGLTGCTFHAQPSSDGVTTNFTHTSGKADSESPMVPDGATGTDHNNYGQTGSNGPASFPSATAFGHYDDSAGQWSIIQQKQNLQAGQGVPLATVTGLQQFPI